MGEHRPRKSQGAAMHALRGARDLYVRGLRSLDRLLAAASPRKAGVGRPTSSRVFGVGGDRGSEEEELQELVRAMQARRTAAPAPSSTGGADASGKEARGAPVVKNRRGATQLDRINEDASAG
jgi:hypothetical protein